MAVRAVRHARALPLVVVAHVHAVVNARDEEVGRQRQGLEPAEDNPMEKADRRRRSVEIEERERVGGKGVESVARHAVR